MKVLREIRLSILIVFLLTVGETYAQNQLEEIYNKGVTYAVQGKFPEATEEFENALKVDPFYRAAVQSLIVINDVIEQKIKRETAIYIFTGLSFDYEGQYVQAINKYTKAININPKYFLIYYYRGSTYSRNSEYDKAISDINKVIEINPNYALAYDNRGTSYFNIGDMVKGCVDLKKACELGECGNYNIAKQSGYCQ